MSTNGSKHSMPAFFQLDGKALTLVYSYLQVPCCILLFQLPRVSNRFRNAIPIQTWTGS